MSQVPTNSKLGIIAGSGSLPLKFVKEAKKYSNTVTTVAHIGETDPEIEKISDHTYWIKVGEFGKILKSFKKHNTEKIVLLGGISRVNVFKDVKIDLKGAALLARVKSTKDDLVMRAMAEELEKEGIETLSCLTFLNEEITPQGVLTKGKLTTFYESEIKFGRQVLDALSDEHVGQLVVVKDGVIVAVEAIEGSDRAIKRGGELAGKNCVVVKASKKSQDMRFDVPTVGPKTIEVMAEVKAKVLALESQKTLIVEKEEFIKKANKAGIVVVGF